MSRYRRINIDGKSLFKTETRVTAAALKPGTFATINDDNQFAQVAAVEGRLYVIDSAYHEGLTITDEVPAGHSAIGNYVEEAREMAVLVAAGTYTKDQAMTVNASGEAAAIPTDEGTYDVIGYCQDDAVLADADFVRIRFRASSVTVAA